MPSSERRNNLDAEYTLAKWLFEQSDTKSDHLALQYALKVAYKHPDAACLVGEAYINGKGVPVDIEAGLQWLKESVRKGSARGKYALGKLIMENRSLNRYDGFCPTDLLIEAMDAGIVKAMIPFAAQVNVHDTQWKIRGMLALQFSASINSNLNRQKLIDIQEKRHSERKSHTDYFLHQAICWYQAGIDEGEIEYMTRFAAVLIHQFGDATRTAEAIALLEYSAAAGDADAQYRLGWQLTNGTKNIRHKVEGALFYEDAAVRGDASSAWNLANMYRYGNGVPKDQGRADYWHQESLRMQPRDPGLRTKSDEVNDNNDSNVVEFSKYCSSIRRSE